MKRNFKLTLLIFMLLLGFFLPALNAESQAPFLKPGPTISMDFKDAGLKDILKVFSMQSGLNFIASEAVQDRTVTLYLDKVPLEKAMDNLFKANNLSYELDEEANIFLVKDWGKPQVETITRVFYLKHAMVSSSAVIEEMANYIRGTKVGEAGEAEEKGKWLVEENAGITKSIKKILSEYGSVIEDFRTNSLIVTDIPSRMAIIAETVKALDVAVPQVMLEVEMLDVSKNVVDKIGIKFGSTSNPSILTMVLKGAKRTTSFPLGDLKQVPSTFTEGLVDFSTGSYTVLLDFLKSQTDTKYLARPKLLTLSNETAEIKIVTQETVGRLTTTTAAEGQTAQTTGVAERIETGVSLRVTPQINSQTGEITMFIMPTVKDTATSSFTTAEGGSTYFKDPEERSTKTTVRIQDGDTVIIGGLIRNEESETITKLPFLGDMPIIGGLFRHKNKDKGRERELLVFITPHIVPDTNIELAQAKKVNLPQREQDTASGLNRESIIGTSLNNFEDED